MITLAQIAELRPLAEQAFERAYQVVCHFAKKAGPDGFNAVVACDAFKRGLEVLDKMRLELISGGRAEIARNAPEGASAPVTPLEDSDAI
jgi:hypothetical protein